MFDFILILLIFGLAIYIYQLQQKQKQKQAEHDLKISEVSEQFAMELGASGYEKENLTQFYQEAIQTHNEKHQNEIKVLTSQHESAIQTFSRMSKNISEIKMHNTLEEFVHSDKNIARYKRLYSNVLLPHYNTHGEIDYHRQIDHLIITSKFILVIETKNWQGINYWGCTPENFPLLADLQEKGVDPIQSKKFKNSVINMKPEFTTGYNEDLKVLTLNFYTDPFNQVRGVAAMISEQTQHVLGHGLDVYNIVHMVHDSKTDNVIKIQNEDDRTKLSLKNQDLKMYMSKLFEIPEQYDDYKLTCIKSLFVGVN